MKAFIRSAPVQSLLALLLAGYIELTLATMRWRLVDTEAADAAVAGPDGLIGAFWHGRIGLSIVCCRRVLKQKPRRGLMSLSRDGEFIAKAMDLMGVPAIRGSSRAKTKDKGKGGATASRQALKFLAEGGCIALTPDGPRGPNQVMQDGVVTLARMGGVPVFLFGMAASPAITMKSWDKSRLPLPFSRGCVVFDGPLYAPADADAAACEILRLDWQNRLNAAQARAEAIIAGTGD